MQIEEIRDVFEERSEQAYMDRKGQIPINVTVSCALNAAA